MDFLAQGCWPLDRNNLETKLRITSYESRISNSRFVIVIAGGRDLAGGVRSD